MDRIRKNICDVGLGGLFDKLDAPHTELAKVGSIIGLNYGISESLDKLFINIL
jgi:hypothetical protein